jgi:CMP-N-acetylneuraminic acid synthetase|tara:strand:+ start:2673 stop:3305 length:633 start_codon:yes stop_codon:yes gene_type:complete
MKIIIPARKGSKGLPGKNTILISHTLSTIPNYVKDNVIITTNDGKVIDQSAGYKILLRNNDLSGDDVSTKDVLANVIQQYSIPDEELIMMLYLTYPERTWTDIEAALNFFIDNKAKSLLCRVEPKSHPYLCMFSEDGNKGRQIVDHNLYRRQDYPECFELSHFICIFRANELEKLNKNLYNKDTMFYKINRPVDVDTKEDLKRYYDKNNC